MEYDKQVHPDSTINEVDHTVVHNILFDKIFHLISVHVSWVYDLKKCYDDISKIIPHLWLHNITTIYQLMVHVLQM